MYLLLLKYDCVLRYISYFYVPLLAVLYTLHHEMNTFYAARAYFILNFVYIFAFLFAPFQWIISVIVYTGSLVYLWLMVKDHNEVEAEFFFSQYSLWI